MATSAAKHKIWCGLDTDHTGECSPETRAQEKAELSENYRAVKESYAAERTILNQPTTDREVRAAQVISDTIHFAGAEPLTITRDDVPVAEVHTRVVTDDDLPSLASNQVYVNRIDALQQARLVLGPDRDIFDLIRAANYILTGDAES